MSSVTFGSVGDIITVCLLAKSIVEALDDSRGSSAEYQGLVSEIRSLECSLLEVELFTRSWRDSITSTSLQRECSKLVNECRKTLEAFQEYLRKYDAYLSKDPRTGILKRTGTKIKWQLLAKDTVARFRSELAGHSNALNMMMITANVMISLSGLGTQKASASSTARSLANQDEELATLRSEIRKDSALSSSMTSMLRTMSQQFTWFTNLLVSVKSMVSQGFRLNLATYRAVMSIQESLGHSMDRTLIQDPFVLEDPLGRIAPVHLQFITSWNAFYAVLATRFEGLPGHKKIERREFVLQERATRREISGEQPWEIAFRPGASVFMSLVFQREVKTVESKSHCPYCGNISEKETADDIHCNKCSMIYRRVTEVTEIDQPTIPGLPNHWSERPSFGQTGFNDQPLKFGPFVKRKRAMESWEELSLSEEVRSFKRVRILANIKKARRAAFASWEDKLSWEVAANEQIRTNSGEHNFETNSSSSARVDAGCNDLLASSILSGASFYHTAKTKQTGEMKQPGQTVLGQTTHIVEDVAHRTDFEKHEISESSNSEVSDDEISETLFTKPSGQTVLGQTTHIVEDVAHTTGFEKHDISESTNSEVSDDEISETLFEVLLLRRSCALRLNAKRARLLQFLPNGPILSLVMEPLCQILDIGSDLMWSSVAAQHMPEARIQSVDTSDPQSSEELLCRLRMYGAGECDLIHMQDWTVAANFIHDLPHEIYRSLKPGGWFEIEIFELRTPRNSCVQLQICPVIIRQGFSLMGIKSFSTAEGIAETLEQASFVNVRSTVERIPISSSSPGNSDEHALGAYFAELLLLALEFIENVAVPSSEPVRSSRLCMIKEIRAVLFGGVDSRIHFMNLVRITAQKPKEKLDG